ELHGIKLGLGNITHLLRLAGDPQREFPTVHVAGTNGKGSVVAVLDAIFRAAGYRTGRFTSPHLLDVRERFLADGKPIPPDKLDRQIIFFQSLAKTMGHSPTFFELNTAIAFRWFAERSVDVGIIEVGMGGRFDSTNVIAPLAAAITTIALEHTKYLGDTLEKIAFEKAGIIKQGVPVICGSIDDGPMNVIARRAKEVSAPLLRVGRDFAFSLGGGPFAQRFSYRGARLSLESVPLALHGRHQGSNAAVAVALAGSLRDQFPKLTQEAVIAGLCTARWPCRLEVVMEWPRVIIDVAHNPAGVKALAESVAAQCVIVLALANDKDAGAILEELRPIVRRLVVTEFSGSGRAMPVEALARAAAGLPVETARTIPDAIERALSIAGADPVLIAGSFFTAAEARRWLMERHGARPPEF
ncbi:MAG: folylpolyglutamate synthase/dihydrofolate synthase family protein, partial [Candidatus Hydrogenedentota bacterium]